MGRLDLETGQKLWYEALDQWQPAHQQALEARAALNDVFIACANGTGPNPTIAQIDVVVALEREDNLLRLQMDDICKRVFGS